MPGVPSGKGCDACRRQKKKCDQGKPACARCTRLDIACVGGGKQRYKFKVQVLESHTTGTVNSGNVDSRIINTGNVNIRIASTGTIKRPRTCVQADPLAVVPRSRATAIAGDFISRLGVADARYDLTCYGNFLQNIPQRLGTNKALDAAVDAFVTAGSTFHSDQHSLMAISKYGRALKALRDCLDDPVRGRTVDTMCAIYLVMVVQGWIGTKEEEDGQTHAEGLSYLLQAATTNDWRGPFETEIIITMCVPVIIESMINPRIQLHPWLFDLLDKYKLPEPLGPERPDHEKRLREDPDSFPSLKMRNLARFPDFLNEPEEHHLDILSTYHMLRFDCGKLHQRASTFVSPDLTSPEGIGLARLHRGVQVAYAMVLSLALILNKILQAFDPHYMALIEESASAIEEVIRLAELSSSARPLGASHIPIGLSLGWAITPDPEVRERLTKLLVEYQLDFKTVNWMKMAYWWKVKFRDVRLQILAHQGESLDIDLLALEVEDLSPSRYCQVQ
ncbi:hypothetical protein AK830_g1978 [Neonectria ditissima]|uniref:Zn(2)-C6 fungal-type domain-containing protein n=1 Tax=Neonectria ditissima TaxID=78410 RepID=A0A0N8H8G9_9HYPO|nr:hypothetical protein AK830_g1978 [Neonectria ditissima]